MSDERRFTIWRCPLGHLSEAPTHGLCSAIGEPIEVVEVDASARVERERDEALEKLDMARGWCDQFRAQAEAAVAERDALRVEVEALTGEQAVKTATDALWGEGPDGNYMQCPPIHNASQARRAAEIALAAARDAAAARAPDQPDR